MAKTPLFRALRRALTLARISNRPGAPPVDELPGLYDEWRLSRRDMLKAGGIAALAAGTSGVLSSCFLGSKTQKPMILDTSLSSSLRIVIVGAGLAGLNAAYTLRKGGILAQVFEGSSRIGGRVYSRTGLLAADLTTELGAEFIDSNHADILTLATDFKLDLLDMESEAESSFATMYYFDGQAYTEAQVIEEFKPIAYLLETDAGIAGDDIRYDNPGDAKKLDHTPLSAYLSKLGVAGWFRKLLEVAYVTEFGLDAGEQSALNLITLIGTNTASDKFEVFGESDERYKIVGGNDKLTQALAASLSGQVSTGQTLESVREKGEGYSLVFRTQNGTAKMVAADVVILALPFTKLRQVEMLVNLSPAKRRTIAELGYGANAKTFLGFVDRPWRAASYSGGIYTDQSYQLAWDNARGQSSTAGGLTLYAGGRNAIEVGKGDVNVLAAKYLGELAMIFEGIDQSYNGKADRFHWPSHPFTLASYSAYRPGQWTTLRGLEPEPAGNIYFAGEHCSMESQGYMNGAAETGRLAAEAILARVRR